MSEKSIDSNLPEIPKQELDGIKKSLGVIHPKFKHMNDLQLKQVVSSVTRIIQHAGPLPPPEQLIEYNNLIDNCGERLMKMNELEQQHRHVVEKSIYKRMLNQNGVLQFGSISLFILSLLTAVLLVYMGAPNVAMVVCSPLGVAAVIGAILGRRVRPPQDKK